MGNLSPLIPSPLVRTDGRGRPEAFDDRAVMDRLLSGIHTGDSRADLPDPFPSPSTSFWRFNRCLNAKVHRKILEALACDLEKRGGINLTDAS